MKVRSLSADAATGHGHCNCYLVDALFCFLLAKRTHHPFFDRYVKASWQDLLGDDQSQTGRMSFEVLANLGYRS